MLQSRLSSPQCQKLHIEEQYGIWIARFGLNIIFGRARWHREPGPLRRTESCVFRLAPLHGGAFAVTAFFLGPADFSDWVPNVFFASRRRGPNPNLFAVVHEGGGAGREKQDRQELGNLIVVDTVSVAIPLTRLIVIAEKIVRLSDRGIIFHLVQQPAKIRRGELVYVGDLKIHWQLDFVILAIHFRELVNVWFICFANQYPISGKLVGHPPHLPKDFANLRQLVCIFVRGIWISATISPAQNPIIIQFRNLEQSRAGANPESGSPPL